MGSVQTLSDQRNKQLLDKAFYKITHDSETSSKYFLRRPTMLNRTRITEVSTVSGNQTSTVIIHQTHTAYYKKVLGTTPTPCSHTAAEARSASQNLLNHVSKKLTEEEAAVLDRPITASEIQIAIQSGKGNSCPGLDGIPIEFYQIAPVNFSNILLHVFPEALHKGALSPGQSKAAVTLLYKKGDAAEPKNYRPIALMQVDAKILDKLISYRIKHLLPKLSHTDQKGFIPGRSIQDNILMLQELRHIATLHNKPWVALSLDFEKAYDRIDRNFLWQVLQTMKIPNSLIQWIQLSYHQSSLLLQNNGWLSEGFEPRTGIKQGSPLSPALFTLAVEPLQQLLRVTIQHTGIPISPMRTKILDAFADDTLLLSSSLANSEEQLSSVTQFEHAANAKLNKDKTKGFFLNRYYRQEPPFHTMMLQPREYFSYLGV